MELSDARVFVKWLTCKGQLCRTELFRIPHDNSGTVKAVPMEYKWVARVDFVYGWQARLGSIRQPRTKAMIET